MKKIECVQVGGMVCDEVTAATVAKYFGRDYQCMFMDCWNFFYNEHIENFLLGDNIGAVNYSKDKNLLQYHGIAKYYRRFDEPEQFVSSLIEMLENNKLVSCKFDQYYMPWALEKRKKEALRYNGYLLFYEYDRISKLFKCIDIHGDRKDREIGIENVRASAAGDVIDLKILNVYSCVNVCEPDYNYLFNLSICNIYKENEFKKTFLQSMSDANQQILKNFSMEKEIDYTYKYVSQISDPTQVIFINSLIDIARMRIDYSQFLEYLGGKLKNNCIVEISNEFKILYSQWRVLISIIIKRFLKKQYSGLNHTIYENIQNLYIREKELARQIMSIDLLNTYNSVHYNNKNQRISKNKQNEYELDIMMYYNNKGMTTNDVANFDGNGNYYVHDFMVENNKKNFDNIICDKQEIVIDNLICNGITIIGSCDSGSLCGEYCFIDKNNNIKKRIIGLSDWRYDRCEFNEECICEMNRYYNNTIKNDEKGYLFKNTISFDASFILAKIILPQCECMHIFKIKIIS